MDGLSHIDVFIYATFKKLNFFYLHFSNVAYYLFSVHFGMPDHTHLRWLNKNVTFVDPKSNMSETYRALNYFRKKNSIDIWQYLLQFWPTLYKAGKVPNCSKSTIKLFFFRKCN